MKYLKSYHLFEIINIPLWPEREGNNNWVFPAMNWCQAIQDYQLVKKWNIGDYKGSWFKGKDGNVIFFHLNDLNYRWLDEPENSTVKWEIKLPENYKEILQKGFEKYKLGVAILKVFLEDYQDGLKVKVAGSNTKLIEELGIKGSAFNLYKSFVKETKKPIFSDTAQTAASRNAIWKKLVNDPQCEVVGYDQKSGKEFDIEEKNGEFVISGNQPIYFGLTPSSQKNDKRRHRTRILKLKSVK